MNAQMSEAETRQLVESLDRRELEALLDDPSPLVKEVARQAMESLVRNSTSRHHSD